MGLTLTGYLLGLVETFSLKHFFPLEKKKKSFIKIGMLHRNVSPPSLQLTCFFVLVNRTCSCELTSCFNFCFALLDF